MKRFVFWTWQALYVLLNGSLGTWHTIHHRTGAACANFFCAGFFFTFNLLLDRKRSKWRAIRQQYEQQLAALQLQANQLIVEFPMEVQEKAEANLQKVVRAVGAEYMHNSYYTLRVGGFCFYVRSDSCHKYSADGHISIGSTCIQAGGLPAAEVTATVLLLLHNNPDIFEFWSNHHGVPYGA